MKASFLEKNDAQHQKYAHLIDGVQHFTGDPRLSQLEQNKMTVLLDNYEREMANSLRMSREQFDEAMTNNAASVSFIKTNLPIIRKVTSNMIAKEFVSVQPMSQPTTKLFYYDVLRDDASSVADAVHTNRNYANNVEATESNPQEIKDLTLAITDSTVSATEKKLKAKWTQEAYQDIMAYHGINVESDLTNALGTEITREWDRTILQALLDGATGGAATFDQTVPAGISYTDRKVWMEMLFEKMIDIDTSIFKKRYRKTNYIVFPAEVAGFIEKMSGFKADPTGANNMAIATGGRYFMGTMSNRWRCYCDPFFPSNKVLMGYNGTDWMDTACVWSPYILSYFTDTFLDPTTFKNVRAVMSRAALKVVVGDLLGVLTITGS